MTKWIKCPKCGINTIEETEELCEVCKAGSPAKIQIHKPKQSARFGETFTFRSGEYSFDKKQGYRAYNSQGEHVGIVFMTDDKRVAAYGNCELHFFPQYYERYGEWHRILSHGRRISWTFLRQHLENNKEYVCYID